MKSSEIIARARGVSDLANVTAITHDDELASLNEAYKDLYAELTDRDDDYYLIETTIVLTAAMRVAGSVNEYLVPLPDDFYKLRWVDYMGNTRWERMERFPLNMKNDETGAPMYRFQANRLWIICGNAAAFAGSIRVGYYPAPVTITAPMTPLSFGTSYLPHLFANVTAPGYAPYHKIMVYAYGGVAIRAESIDNSTVAVPVALFTDVATVTNIVYYKGVLYWIRGGLIWYKPTDLTAAFLAPTQATTPAGVTSFFILNNIIYYTNATQIRQCDLTGSAPSDVLILATVANSVCAIGIPTVNVFFTTAAGELVCVMPYTVLFLTGISEVQSDGTYLYVRDTIYNLRKLEIAIATVATITEDITVASDVIDIGQPQWDVYETPPIYVIPVLKDLSQTLQGFDTTVDYDFAYPSNILPEIMAYQCAVDFRVKQSADPTLQATRLEQLRGTLLRQLRRDEYAPERIRNAY